MGFLGVCRAIYDYAPQAQGELAITEGDLLYVLENSGDDGWWKVKKKAGGEDEEEPEGLVPNNYVEEAPSVGHARALYDYTRQTDEELSFSEDALLEVYDTSDPDWILVGSDGEFGFVPSNYIEVDAAEGTGQPPAPPSPQAPPSLPARPMPEARPPPPESPVPTSPSVPNPAAALAGVMHTREASGQSAPASQPTRQIEVYDEPRSSDGESIRSPALPARPPPPRSPSPTYSDPSSPTQISAPTESSRTPGGFHMYNINEMVSIMGKRKKMPTTLGINLRTGVILVAPEHAQDGPSQEWTADRMTHYSRESKHVFMELVRPSKSYDFHAGAKDTAEEIMNALGELAGAVRAGGLQEVIMAGTDRSKKKGQILYDFMAQGDDEVTVAVGDEVVVLDNTKSEDWWQVRRLKNGKEGVVPSSYVEITGTVVPQGAEDVNPARSIVEQNRLEEIRLTKEAIKASKEPQQVGPGMLLPERGSSLAAQEIGSNSSQQQRSRRENGRNDGDGNGQAKPKPKPDSSKVRTWTDRSRSFSVEAQFLGLRDGKIHLHKMNGVKIAVPITKMSREDLEYVEGLTGISLEDEKPLADVKRARTAEKRSSEAGATIDKTPKLDYDWFQFFLSCEVAVGLCERYAQAFIRDSMDESVLPDVDANTLRALGLREGDIIKVMRALDVKFGRKNGKRNVSFSSEQGEGEGGLFSGPGGTLRNNTRKGRPAPAMPTNDVVDASAFSKSEKVGAVDANTKSPTSSSPIRASPEARPPAASGFDDDAWDVKPAKQPPPAEKTPKPTPKPASPERTEPAPPQVPALTGSMKELSLLDTPLQPTKVEPPAPAVPKPDEQPPSATTAPLQQPQLTGATPSFFTAVAQSQPPAQPRMRPAPPPAALGQNQTGLVPPPPQRPLSAPQSAQPSAFSPPPMMPQMTGSLQGQVAPPGQSLNDITQARFQQQQYAAQLQQQAAAQQAMQPAMTGYAGNQAQPMMPFATGTPGQFMQPMMTGAPGANQFTSIQPQPTGFQPGFPQTQSMYRAPPGAGINNYLPPALEPQRTGMSVLQPQATGQVGANGGGTVPQPLQPQQTGPPPPVRFGVTGDTKKLTPQATGRRANLAQATPQNPFGF